MGKLMHEKKHNNEPMKQRENRSMIEKRVKIKDMVSPKRAETQMQGSQR